MAVVGFMALSAQAAEYDLTSTGATATIDGAVYTQVDPQTTGTGVFQPFMRIQATGTEEGYNTSERPMDLKNDSWTIDLPYASLAVVQTNGIDYYVFNVDINEATGGGNKYLSLDQLQVYTSTTAGQDVDDITLLVGTLRYDLDLITDHTILLDYALNPGSGAGDLDVFVPLTYFTAGGGVPAGEEWLILYSEFGVKGGDWGSGDGFEEWRAVIPEPSTAVTVGLGILSLAGLLRRRRS
ncbi:PEP-CTERM sorting domain-containing protein [bacterium]|nr:PEP-CTERM sorting domain-containing protein [bacterium]